MFIWDLFLIEVSAGLLLVLQSAMLYRAVTETRVFGNLHVFRVPKDNYNKCAKKNVQILCTLKSYYATDCLLVGTPPPLGRPPQDTSD